MCEHGTGWRPVCACWEVCSQWRLKRQLESKLMSAWGQGEEADIILRAVERVTNTGETQDSTCALEDYTADLVRQDRKSVYGIQWCPPKVHVPWNLWM